MADMRLATLVLGVFILGAVLGANCDRPAAAQGQRQSDLYVVARYSPECNAGLCVFWFEQGDAECWISRWGYSGGISCLRREPAP